MIWFKYKSYKNNKEASKKANSELNDINLKRKENEEKWLLQHWKCSLMGI